jgi:acyl-[acyl-carrier-protein]-phospholipid O-acyltransferase/long-chain-fatty-acid--[acyl-carrier-protein] ligase
MNDQNTHGSFGRLLKDAGFHSFLWTQFLGAFNDNVLKQIVSLRAVHLAASTGSSAYLSLVGAVFVLPFLLFSGYSGHLADVVSKRRVLVAVKVFEIGIMVLAFAALFTSRIEYLLGVLFLMALHSTLFSPAKYGLVPEILPDRELSRANALLEMSTFVAIVLGTSIGTFLYSFWKAEPWKMGLVMIVVSIAGFLTSLRITRVPPSGATQPFRLNPFAEVITGTKHMLKDRPLWLAVMAISYFWFLGALFQMDLLLFGAEVLKADDLRVGLMITCLAVGIGAGSMLAGKLSGDKVELGLVPLGSIFMSVFCVLLWMVSSSYMLSVIVLSMLGLAAGLFAVPLNAYMQQRAESKEKGRIIATNNFWNTVGLLLASGVLWVLNTLLGIAPDTLILIFGFVTLAATVYIVRVVPDYLMRFILWSATHTLFKIRVVGAGNVPQRGAALLVSNHMTHVDGFLITSCVQRFIRFMVWKPYYEAKALNWFFRLAKAIPVGQTGPRDVVESIRAARKQLSEGHIVCIFAEGAISRTGNLLPFKRGMERIVDGLDVPIIPVHLDRLWGSIFSFDGGRFFWKKPKRVPYPVTVSFGQPLPASSSVHEVRQAILELGSHAVEQRKDRGDLLPLRFIRSARSRWKSFAMADSTGRQLTYGEALIAGVLVSDWLTKNRPGEMMIGLMLPSSVAGALANTGVTLAGCVPVNLNFTAGRESMAAAIAQCAIKTVITSKAFLAKAKLETPDGACYIEDIFSAATPAQKFFAALRSRLLPARSLVRGNAAPDSLATVIFSSGSTGVPKGVMLSHANIIANIESMAQVFWLSDEDRIVGVLPFFHSFGFTVTIWLPLVAGCGAVYHPNPTDAKAIGELIAKHRGTFLLSTPTFCSTYARKCTREQFASLRYVLVGAEKLRESVARQFQETFGRELLEGYGCTEMAPVVAVNAPNYEAGRDTQLAAKPGTVGQAIPGVAIRTVDPATFEPLGANEEGLLLVKGANRMMGYLGQPERTAEVVRDGWYVTGAIAVIDDEGFIRITDRLSRFSKIGGEMVPHIKIEESVYQVAGDVPCAVAGVPDEQRGERLVLLYASRDLSPQELWQKLSDSEIPRLWLPKRENVYQIDALPTLGTGKTDLRAVKAMALEFSSAKTQTA